MDFKKISENFRIIGEALLDSGKELINGVKEELTPKTTEEKLEEARQKIASDPNLTKEDILDILSEVDKKSVYEESVEDLREKVNQGWAKLMDIYEDAPEQAKKVKVKIQTIISVGSKEELIEALKLEQALSKANEGSKKISKRIKHILNSFVDDIDD